MSNEKLDEKHTSNIIIRSSTKVVQMWSCGQTLTCHRCHNFTLIYTGQIFFWKSFGLTNFLAWHHNSQGFHVWYIVGIRALLSSTKSFVQIMPLGSKLTQPHGHSFKLNIFNGLLFSNNSAQFDKLHRNNHSMTLLQNG